MKRRSPRSSSSSSHRLLFVPDLDKNPYGAALWQQPDPPPTRDCQLLLDTLCWAVRTQLTHRQRTAVELFFFEGLSQGDIARRLGVSQQVVQKRIYGDRRNGRIVGGAIGRLRQILTPIFEQKAQSPPNKRAPNPRTILQLRQLDKARRSPAPGQ